jgi:hypothetical protein
MLEFKKIMAITGASLLMCISILIGCRCFGDTLDEIIMV